VVEDPEDLGGTQVIRDKRAPIYDVAASIAAGLPMTASGSVESFQDLEHR
jgi:uncharacterized protein (DUF433 family)